jgi:plastocyanin
MCHGILKIFVAAGLVATCAARASTVDIAVTDGSGAPAPNAVVTLTPNSSIEALASHAPARSVIDQRHETFLPLVVVVRKGGEVVFTNHDTTMHQVYSFSQIKQFQFEIDKHEVSKPVVFDKPGVAAIGCNIHDNMVAYVFVSDAPFTAITDEDGHAEIRDVPEGSFRVATWHPQLRVGLPSVTGNFTVTPGLSKFSVSLPLTRTAMPSMSHMHKSDY